jgi:hypothetical protein
MQKAHRKQKNFPPAFIRHVLINRTPQPVIVCRIDKIEGSEILLEQLVVEPHCRDPYVHQRSTCCRVQDFFSIMIWDCFA